MENPAYWNDAVKLLNETIAKHMKDKVIGASAGLKCYQALVDAGYMQPLPERSEPRPDTFKPK